MSGRCLAACVLLVALWQPCFGSETVAARGTVVDPEGSPVGGVKVFAVMSVYVEQMVASVKGAAVTRPDGSFEIKPLPRPGPRGMYYLVAFAPDQWLGCQTGQGELVGSGRAPAAPLKGYRITVSKPGIFEGRVVDEGGNPIPGATVRLSALMERADGPSRSPRFAIIADVLKAVVKPGSATTDSEGNFRLTGVPAHLQPNLAAVKPGYAMKWDPDAFDPRRLVLVPGGSIRGMVVDERGKGVPGMAVVSQGEIRHGRSFMHSGGGAETTEDGSYIIHGLLPTTHYVKLLPRGDVSARPVDNILVKSGEVADAGTMVTARTVPLNGRILDADTGRPVAGGWVNAYEGERSQATFMHAQVDGRGRYSFRALPGEYQIYYQGENPLYAFTPRSTQTVRLPKSGLRDYVIRAKKGTFAAGRVIDEKGRPVPGAKVTLNGWFAKATADGAGRFKIAVPPPAQDDCYG